MHFKKNLFWTVVVKLLFPSTIIYIKKMDRVSVGSSLGPVLANIISTEFEKQL